MPEAGFRPERILAVLHDHDVRCVLIGGFAAVIYGSPYVTTDVDVVPATTGDNLERLAGALAALHARVWTDDEPGALAFPFDAASLAANRVWNLVTDDGRLDIAFEPSGTGTIVVTLYLIRATGICCHPAAGRYPVCAAESCGNGDDAGDFGD